MAEAVEKYRQAARRNSARAVGLRIDQPNTTAADMHLLGGGNHTDIFALPVDGTEWHPLQDITPGSPTLGELYFLPGIDIPGDPRRIMR